MKQDIITQMDDDLTLIEKVARSIFKKNLVSIRSNYLDKNISVLRIKHSINQSEMDILKEHGFRFIAVDKAHFGEGDLNVCVAAINPVDS